MTPGEPIVLVLAASAHRQPALDATAFLIDWLKTRAPFWKQEEGQDGAVAWVDARAGGRRGRRALGPRPYHPRLTRLSAVPAVLAGAVLLAWPALLNRYPILFSDTGGLLEMGLLPSIGWDKPFVYGPIIAVLSLRQTLWLPLAAQSILVSYTLWAAQQAFAEIRPARHLALCLALALGTAAPWFTSTLMPDALTAVAALALAASLGQPPPGHRLALPVIAAVAITAHLSHLILAAAVIAALAILRRSVPIRALGSLAAVLLFLLGTNWIGHGRLAVSPYGSVFALARLIADGPARDYLDRVCPQAGFRLCAWRDKLTEDSDQFLWDPNGPFWADPAPLSAIRRRGKPDRRRHRPH